MTSNIDGQAELPESVGMPIAGAVVPDDLIVFLLTTSIGLTMFTVGSGLLIIQLRDHGWRFEDHPAQFVGLLLLAVVGLIILMFGLTN